MSQKLNLKKGFTLIELLVVISIISLLSSIILVSINSARAKARDTQRIAELRSIRTALEWYYLDNNHYPWTLTDINDPASAVWVCSADFGGTLPGGCVVDANYGLYNALVPKYMPSLPKDPTSGATRGYAYKSDGIGYKVLDYDGIEATNGSSFADQNEARIAAGIKSFAVCTDSSSYLQSGGTDANSPCANW